MTFFACGKIPMSIGNTALELQPYSRSSSELKDVLVPG